jgi:hypothetical protein
MLKDVFVMKKGDTRPLFRAFLNDPDDNPINLSSSTVVMELWNLDTGNKLVVNGTTSKFSCTVVDGTRGEIVYNWADPITDYPGVYRGRFLVDNILSVPNEDYFVLKIEDL